MATVTIHEAQTNLSMLIARAEAGEEIVIARNQIPVVTLSAIEKPKRRVFGAFKGQFEVPPDSFFFDPLPDEELLAWGDGPEHPAR